jgi:hypothetical protein
MSGDALSAIVGAELSAVVFVRDYVQLQFDGPILTAITLPVIVTAAGPVRAGERGYRDALCEQIGKEISSVSITENDSIKITLFDNSTIVISLRPEDYRSAEAVHFRDEHGRLSVW